MDDKERVYIEENIEMPKVTQVILQEAPRSHWLYVCTDNLSHVKITGSQKQRCLSRNVMYNPGPAMEGHCTYACMAYVLLGHVPTRHSTMMMRSVIAEGWRKNQGLLEEIANANGMSMPQYIRTYV